MRPKKSLRRNPAQHFREVIARPFLEAFKEDHSPLHLFAAVLAVARDALPPGLADEIRRYTAEQWNQQPRAAQTVRRREIMRRVRVAGNTKTATTRAIARKLRPPHLSLEVQHNRVRQTIRRARAKARKRG